MRLMKNQIHIFKPGTHTTLGGASLSFSESDLAASAAAYDPAIHEAPLVVGHPKTDDPAYGWVRSLQFAESGLSAEPQQVDAEFAEMVNAGRFKKISAAFYPPDAPTNPVPGVYYLRHVGFLGAQPPAIKGLKQVEFADSGDCVTIEFSEWDDVQNASLWRNFREWLLFKFGQEDADKVVPQYAVQQLEQSAQDELRESQNDPQPLFADPNPGDTMSADEKARLAELEAENNRLKQQAAEFAEAQKRDRKAAINTAHVEFAEGLIKAGTLLPAQKAVAVAMLNALAEIEQPVEFGEGDSKKPLIEAVKADLFGALPKQVEFGEITPREPVRTEALTGDAVKAKALHAWNASADLRAEFGEFEIYEAFVQADSAGLVKIRGDK